MEKQIILPEHIELTEETKTLYKDKDGHFYLSKERAQEKLATHFPCKCGNGIREKFRIYCDNCEPAEKPKPFKDWDGETPLYLDSEDKYFFSKEELDDYIHDNELNPEELTFFICEPNYYSNVELDSWEDVLTEDQEELPKEIQTKLDELNDAINNYGKPASWSPSKYRTKVSKEI
jgi:hypothetical protein